ncbi:AAA family ATPase [Nanoarchaeota archaeon]
MLKKKHKKYLERWKPEHYINSSIVTEVGGTYLNVWDIIKSALVKKLNIFLAGETGEGKTQLEKDILGLFGNKGVFILGRNDMDIRELFRKISGKKLDQLRQGLLDSDEVTDLTEMLNYHVFVCDEQTRCIPAVQNQLFNLYDGYIELDGKIYTTGDGYCVGVASGNIGNKYVGTSSQDRALLDRMHILLDMDNADFSPTPVDFLNILAKNNGPRVKDAVGKHDRSSEIIDVYQTLKDQKPSWEQYIGALYLRFGLDYLESTKHHSKRHAKNIWPNIPHLSDDEKKGDSTLIYPISSRAALTCIDLGLGMKAVAEAKGAQDINETELFLDAFRIIGSYSGILNTDQIMRDPNYEGNLYTAMGDINSRIKSELDIHLPKIFESLAYANTGTINNSLMKEFTGSWGFMQPVIRYTAERARSEKIPVEASLEEVIAA